MNRYNKACRETEITTNVRRGKAAGLSPFMHYEVNECSERSWLPKYAEDIWPQMNHYWSNPLESGERSGPMRVRCWRITGYRM